MTEQSPNTVEVTYTLGDLYAVTLQSWRTHLFVILLLPVIVLAILMLLAVIGGSSIVDSIFEFPWEFIFGLVGLLLLARVGLSPLISYIDARRARNLGPIRFELSGDGIRIEAQDGQSLLYWSAVKRVAATRRRLFLFTGSTALILPRRVLRDQAQFEATIYQARENWEAARA